MAKFCGKCGSMLDEKTGLCPKCDGNPKEPDLKESESKKTKPEHKKRKKIWFVILPIAALIVIFGGALTLAYFHVISVPVLDNILKVMRLDEGNNLKRYFYSFSSDYTILEEDSDGTFLISVEAPDFSKIIIEETKDLPEGQTKEMDRSVLIQMVEDHPDDVTAYEFEVNSLDSSEIKEKFFDTVTYKMLVGTISNTEPLTGAAADGGDNP